MQLEATFKFDEPDDDVPHFEYNPFPVVPGPLGALSLLPGKWQGQGFNTIWRPFHDTTPAKQDRFLELNRTTETITFETINGAIPNRGLLQPDINMFGLTYLQQIADSNENGAGLHIEPGIWCTVPATTNPAEPTTVVRMASIPHGTTIMAQGIAVSVDGPPKIVPNNITPFVIGDPAKLINFPESNLAQPTAFRSHSPQIDGITQAMVENPNSVLLDAILGQEFHSTIALIITTDVALPLLGGGTENTGFLAGTKTAGPNAQGANVTAIFWIEIVKGTPDFLQLQYTQTVLLNFNGLSWPHVTVATLRKVEDKPIDLKLLAPRIPPDVRLDIDAKSRQLRQGLTTQAEGNGATRRPLPDRLS